MPSPLSKILSSFLTTGGCVMAPEEVEIRIQNMTKKQQDDLGEILGFFADSLEEFLKV